MGSRSGEMAFCGGQHILSLLKGSLAYTSSSAFDMMRFPWITTSVLKGAVPALSSIDPHILARVDVDGAQLSPGTS